VTVDSLRRREREEAPKKYYIIISYVKNGIANLIYTIELKYHIIIPDLARDPALSISCRMIK
jgi:hypothetical protein